MYRWATIALFVSAFMACLMRQTTLWTKTYSFIVSNEHKVNSFKFSSTKVFHKDFHKLASYTADSPWPLGTLLINPILFYSKELQSCIAFNWFYKLHLVEVIRILAEEYEERSKMQTLSQEGESSVDCVAGCSSDIIMSLVVQRLVT